MHIQDKICTVAGERWESKRVSAWNQWGMRVSVGPGLRVPLFHFFHHIMSDSNLPSDLANTLHIFICVILASTLAHFTSTSLHIFYFTSHKPTFSPISPIKCYGRQCVSLPQPPNFLNSPTSSPKSPKKLLPSHSQRSGSKAFSMKSQSIRKKTRSQTTKTMTTAKADR